MKILLIAGHGAGDPGAVAKIKGKTYKEANLTREAVKALKPMLEEYGASVKVYPTTHDAYQDYNNGKLASTANFKSHDYILEIHFNAGGSDLKGDGKIKGDECYWPSRGKSTGLEKPITSRIFTGVAQRPSKSGKFAVINTADSYGVKANLLEVCFIDDADDMAEYLANKSKIAQNIADGVAEYFKLSKTKAASAPKTTTTKTAAKTTPATTTPKRVKVTASALNIRKGAGTNYAITGVIRDNGVYTIVEEKGGWGKLKSGAGWICLSYTKAV